MTTTSITIGLPVTITYDDVSRRWTTIVDLSEVEDALDIENDPFASTSPENVAAAETLLAAWADRPDPVCRARCYVQFFGMPEEDAE